METIKPNLHHVCSWCAADGSGGAFVQTPTVQGHLRNLARAVLLRRYPILLQASACARCSHQLIVRQPTDCLFTRLCRICCPVRLSLLVLPPPLRACLQGVGLKHLTGDVKTILGRITETDQVGRGVVAAAVPSGGCLQQTAVAAKSACLRSSPPLPTLPSSALPACLAALCELWCWPTVAHG